MIDFGTNIEYVNRKQKIIEEAISALKDLEDYKLISDSKNVAEISKAITSLENIKNSLNKLETTLTALFYEEADFIASCYSE